MDDAVREEYPQEWPDHLSEDVDLGSYDGSPPAGYHGLLFEKLNSRQFEQLCWWLIRKDHELIGCQLVGGNGRAQQGIDLFAFDRLDPDKLIVFQCKCWEELPTTRLTDAVDLFLAGKWGKKTHRFVLVIAQPELAKLADGWDRERDKLRKAGIVPDVWTGMDLTYEMRRFPDIVSKFFPGATSHAFCNEWMQRVGFYERLQQALVDRRPEVAKIAKDFIGIKSADEVVTRIRNDRNWVHKSPWVYVSAMLPDVRFPVGTVLVNIHQPDVEGVMVVLSQKWLCRQFLGNVGAPRLPEYRPFLGPELTSDPQSRYVDLENSRFSLPEDYIRAVTNASDELSEVFSGALRDLEAQRGAQYFPFVSDEQVAICAMPEWLWRTILDFARDHDFEEGETNWHIFDAAHGALKPYTRRPHPKYDAGYHGIFYARDRGGDLVYDDEVLVVWSSPSLSGADIHERKWWPCSYALRWLETELLPVVGEWIESKQGKWSLSRNRNAQHWWAENAKVRDVRLLPLALEQRYRAIGLVKTIKKLQAFFNGHGYQDRIYLDSKGMRNIYSALITLLQGGLGYPRYIAGNLSFRQSGETHDEIIARLRDRLAESELPVNSSILDFTLRAMLEAIKDDESWLAEPAKEAVFRALMPLMEFFDQSSLLKRHSEWI